MYKNDVCIIYNEIYSMTTSFAYVWCIFGGDNYIKGAIPSAYSVKLTETKNDLVCMVTKDVTNEGKSLLLKIFNHVIEVPYLIYKTKLLKTKKQQEMYKSWSDKGYTKFNCLSLTQYKKILLMDADTIVLQNLDHLFDLQTPAATFSSPWCYLKNGIPLKYTQKHGDKIIPSEVKDGLNNGGIVAIATTMLLEPSFYEEYKKTLEDLQPIGFNCHSMVDEQTISYFFSIIKNQNWTYIHQKYNTFINKYEWLKGEKPVVLHYFNIKTWITKRSKWNDMEPYYQIVDLLIEKGLITKEYIEGYEKIKEIECFWCKNHKTFKRNVCL